MTNERAYTPSLVLHVLRNPHGWSVEAITAARLQAADEIEQLRADISEAYYLRDKAEGRFCTALGSIEQLHAAVKTAQELAATRLMEREKLQMRLKRHEPVSLYNGHDIDWWKAEAERLRGAMQTIVSDGDYTAPEGMKRIAQAALSGSHEPLPCAPRESDWCCTHCGRDNDPSETHCVHCEWSRKHTVAGVLHERGCEDNPCRCGALKSQGASRDKPSEQQSAREDLAYYNGARQAATIAHQSLSAMDKWINGGCGGRWQEAKAAGASRDASSGVFDIDLAHLDSVRKTMADMKHYGSLQGIPMHAADFLLSFIDNLWREYSRVSREASSDQLYRLRLLCTCVTEADSNVIQVDPKCRMHGG